MEKVFQDRDKYEKAFIFDLNEAKSGLSVLPSALLLPWKDLAIGNFQDDKKLVKGSFNGIQVAVKLLEVFPQDSKHKDVLLKEVRNLVHASALCHKVVKLHGMCIVVDDSVGFTLRLALVMKFYPKNLAQHLKGLPGGCMPLSNVLILARDLLQALVELHKAGITLLGLRPEKVLLDEAGQPILADFGLSRAIKTATSQAGKPDNYMAPEQFREKKVGAEADIWGLAAVLLHAITGEGPWEGLNNVEIADQMKSETTCSPGLPPWLPPALHNLLSNCFKFAPTSRPSAPAALDRVMSALKYGLEGSRLLELQNDDGLRKQHANITHLHSACVFGEADLVDHLLKEGVDIEAADENGWRALHLACYYKRMPVVKRLLAHEAAVWARTTAGETPLDIAKKNDDITLMQWLMEAGEKATGSIL